MIQKVCEKSIHKCGSSPELFHYISLLFVYFPSSSLPSEENNFHVQSRFPTVVTLCDHLLVDFHVHQHLI